MLNAIVSSPVAPPSIPHTPATAGRIKPPHEEMHPGKGHSVASPSFDFRFARPAAVLGPEAQKMMDEIREEAAKIKERLATEREEERKKAELDGTIGENGRRIAVPKGKLGRFSAAHMEEFKKMDSIANHPSAFRAQTTKVTQDTVTLKRSRSKAKLDDRDDEAKPPQTPSKSGVVERSTIKRVRLSPELEQTKASTPKAMLPTIPKTAQPETPTLSRSRSVLASLTTPTQASLARAASVKQGSKIPTLTHSPSKASLAPSNKLSGLTHSPSKASLVPSNKFPSLTHSPSKASLATPNRLLKSATMGNMSAQQTTKVPLNDTVQSPTKLDRLKSLLHRSPSSPKKPEPAVVSTPSKAMAPPTLTPSKSVGNQLNLNKELPAVPGTPKTEQPQAKKHVTFTPTAQAKAIAMAQHSPSPLRVSGIPRSKSTMTLNAIQYPALSTSSASEKSSDEVNYPILPVSPDMPQPPATKPAEHAPAAPGTFTFRSDMQVKFASASVTMGMSPGKSSIRAVRASILPTTTMPGSFPEANKENIGGLPAIPHGLSNKKRHRAGSDDGSEGESLMSPSKKQKTSAADVVPTLATKVAIEQQAPKSKIPSPAKRRGLSLGRLNMLARPKNRK
jgi:hypothetical protein